MTERLYYTDSHMREFSARVLSCAPEDMRWDVVLDRTAFFPEGGGQPADTGTLGGVRVEDVHERGGEIRHLCDAPLEPGTDVTGHLDWERRFRMMQGHSGEHVLSGTVHRLYGCDNVGFHMGGGVMTVDFDGELSPEQLLLAEDEANRAVYANLAVTARFPSREELATMTYRSKRDDFDELRIVTIEDCDACACCAPHVSRTGEIGIIKIIDWMRHRGGMRLTLACGLNALDDFRARLDASKRISAELSAKQDALPEAVKRLKEERDSAEYALNGLRRELIKTRAAALTPTDGDTLLFEDGGDADSLRELANAGAAVSGGLCAVFGGTDGDWRYVIASRFVPLKGLAKDINAALNGRGGGTDAMIQGSVKAGRDVIQAFFSARNS